MLNQVDRELVELFEKHASRFRMAPSHSFNMKLLDHYLDQVAPLDPDPALFDKHGHLINRELQAHLERMRRPKPAPRVFSYLNEPTN